jgi:hypothetical protein
VQTRIDPRLFLVLLALGASPACGGSSSETPPPLEPDPRGNNYLGHSGQATADADLDAGTVRSSRPRRSNDVQPGKSSAPSTWGSGRGTQLR